MSQSAVCDVLQYDDIYRCGPAIPFPSLDRAMFHDAQFDVVTASHVLEHIAVPYLD